VLTTRGRLLSNELFMRVISPPAALLSVDTP
jgi:hypothetical protein